MSVAQPPTTAAPRFDPNTLTLNSDGLIPAIAQQHNTGEVLMLAWMNPASIAETLKGGRVVYWSRSRQAFWRKGDSSGHIQRLIDMRLDCDRDCLLLLVDQTGPACHTFRRSCFYTALRPDNDASDGDAATGDNTWREIELTSPMQDVRRT